MMILLSLSELPIKTRAVKTLLSSLNPFAPEPPVTARADPGPFYPL